MKVFITLDSIEELDSLLSLKSRTKASNGILHTMPSPEDGEDGEAVAYFTEELSKIIDARKKKDWIVSVGLTVVAALVLRSPSSPLSLLLY